jgi:dTDP-4-amino-4,6-dideoxygalactose transaminase
MQSSSKTQEIIGGMFGLHAENDSNPCPPPFIQEPSLFFINARSAIWYLVNHLAPEQVWCPSYLCHTILDAVEKTGADIRFYEVNNELAIPSLSWLGRVKPGDLVILIDYFGFNCDSECARKAKEMGAWILEDASQALLTGNVGQNSDFVVYSPRKFLGVPDGGILQIQSNIEVNSASFETPPTQWWQDAFMASLLRRDFDLNGGGRPWFDLFQKTEPNAPIGPYRMSELSKVLLQNSFDYLQISEQRTQNYRTLAELLSESALFPSLPDPVVPLGFPICLSNRDQVRHILFDNEIYPPVHWPLQSVVPEEYANSHHLASRIMTLPCDQRYNQEDMVRMASLVLKALEC